VLPVATAYLDPASTKGIENMGDQKKMPETHDLLTAAAEAIGSTLGRLAVKTGIAKPAVRVSKRRTPAAKKKAPATKMAARAVRSKVVSKRKSPAKPRASKER
jgi:hypothetical protein